MVGSYYDERDETAFSSARLRAMILEMVYVPAEPFESLGEHNRFYHHDLDAMTPTELRREHLRVELRLALDPRGRDEEWLEERLDAIRAALARAGSAAR